MTISRALSDVQQVLYDDVNVGDPLPRRSFGPYSIVDGVRWASFQENWAQMHYDQDYARTRSGLNTFVASGCYRQTLLLRALTDWIGPRGSVRKLTLRHIFPTYEGDEMNYSGHIVAKSIHGQEGLVECELECDNQTGRPIMLGRCTVTLPLRPA